MKSDTPSWTDRLAGIYLLSAVLRCAIAAAVLLFAAFPVELYALPQFSLLTGNRCQNCHTNFQGGGLRNELGWYSNNDVSLLAPADLGLEGFYEAIGESNTLFDDALTIGLDFRMQRAKSNKSADAETKIFPMQAALHAAYNTTDWLVLEGTFNFGKARYKGQAVASVSALFQPSFAYPQVRVGFFQPSIGIRYDDHTVLVRQIPGTDYTPLIAPNYAEAGVEIAYEGLKWLSVDAGVFRADMLAENTVQDRQGVLHDLVDNNSLSAVGRMVFWPRFFEGMLNTYAGASLLSNGSFSLVTTFAGIGWTDRVSLLAEYAESHKTDMRKTEAVSVELLYQLSSPILLYVRGERGRTTQYLPDDSIRNYMTQWVFGAQLFVLPYVELRPEYRIVDTEQFPQTTDQFKSGRFTTQLHIFY